MKLFNLWFKIGSFTNFNIYVHANYKIKTLIKIIDIIWNMEVLLYL